VEEYIAGTIRVFLRIICVAFLLAAMFTVPWGGLGFPAAWPLNDASNPIFADSSAHSRQIASLGRDSEFGFRKIPLLLAFLPVLFFVVPKGIRSVRQYSLSASPGYFRREGFFFLLLARGQIP
jgi:hypothetical protein